MLDHQGQEGGDSPGNSNAAVSTGDHAVLLLRVDHSGVNFEGRAGVDYWTGSTEDRDADKSFEFSTPISLEQIFLRISQEKGGAASSVFIFSLWFKNIPVENGFIHTKGPNYEV